MKEPSIQDKSSLINDILNWESKYGSAHALLSVSKTASLQEIEAAYKRLARKIHPDKHKNSVESCDAFKLLGEAKDYLLYLRKSYVEQKSQIQTMLCNPFYKASAKPHSSSHATSTGFHPGSHSPFGSGHHYSTESNNYAHYFSSTLFAKSLNRVSEVLLKDLNYSLSPDGNDDFKIGEKTKAHALDLSKIYMVHHTTDMLPWLYLFQNEEDLSFFCSLFLQLKDAKWPDLETQSDALFFHEKGYLLKAGETVQLWMIKFLFIHHATDKGKQAMGVTLIKAGQFELFKTLYEEGWFDKCDKHAFIEAIGENKLGQLSEFFKRYVLRLIDSSFLNSQSGYKFGPYCKLSYSTCSFKLEYTYLQSSPDMLGWLYHNQFLTPETALYTGIALHHYELVERVLKSNSDLSIDLFSALSLFMLGSAYSGYSDFRDTMPYKRILPKRFGDSDEDIQACQCELLNLMITRFRPADGEKLDEILKLVLIDFLRGGRSSLRSDDRIEKRLFSPVSLYHDNAAALFKVVNQHITNEEIRAAIWKNALYKWSSFSRMADVLSTEGKDYIYGNNLGMLDFEYLCEEAKTERGARVKKAHRHTLGKLIQAEPRLMEKQYESVVLKFRYMPQYLNTAVTGYHMNMLHLGCYYGHEAFTKTMVETINKETQAHLINHMTDIIAVQTPTNNWLVHMAFHKGYMTSQKASQYNAFHEAIMQGFDDIALMMIDKGADIHQKATLWHRCIFLFWFNYLTKTEETPLELALKSHLPKTAHRLLVEELKSYINNRKQQGDYLTRIGYGTHTFWGFGYSKESKIEAANQLLDSLQKGADASRLALLKKQYPAIAQGRLGTLYSHAIFIQSNWQIKNGHSMPPQTSEQELEEFKNNYGIYEKQVTYV